MPGIPTAVARVILAQADSREEQYARLLGLKDMCTLRNTVDVELVDASNRRCDHSDRWDRPASWVLRLRRGEHCLQMGEPIIVKTPAGFQATTLGALAVVRNNQCPPSFDLVHNVLSVHGWTLDAADAQLIRDYKAKVVEAEDPLGQTEVRPCGFEVTFTMDVPRCFAQEHQYALRGPLEWKDRSAKELVGH